MAEDLVTVLTRFHRDVLLPDVTRLIQESEGRLRDEMHSIFDGISHRLDRLETEYQMLVAGVKRIEERLDRLEQRMDRFALRSEIEDLRSRVKVLETRLAELDSEL